LPVRPEIHGHRGARGLWPENTLAACAGALAIGVDAIEIDVLVSADDRIVVHHDHHLNPDLARTAGGDWIASPTPALIDLDLDALRSYDVGRVRPGSRPAVAFPRQQASDGERIPVLEQIVALLAESRADQVTLNIEAKSRPTRPRLCPEASRFADLLAGEIVSLGIEDRVIVQSFDWQFLHFFEAQLPLVATSYLTEARTAWKLGDQRERLWTGGYARADFTGSVPEMIRAAGGRAWSAEHTDVDRASVDAAHRLNIRIYAWTVNDPERMVELVRIGVDGIITDYPDRLRYTLAGMDFDVPAPARAVRAG
jgi:glycerophosphoryl diester phosphodiesterase